MHSDQPPQHAVTSGGTDFQRSQNMLCTCTSTALTCSSGLHFMPFACQLLLWQTDKLLTGSSFFHLQCCKIISLKLSQNYTLILIAKHFIMMCSARQTTTAGQTVSRSCWLVPHWLSDTVFSYFFRSDASKLRNCFLQAGSSFLAVLPAHVPHLWYRHVLGSAGTARATATSWVTFRWLPALRCTQHCSQTDVSPLQQTTQAGCTAQKQPHPVWQTEGSSSHQCSLLHSLCILPPCILLEEPARLWFLHLTASTSGRFLLEPSQMSLLSLLIMEQELL